MPTVFLSAKSLCFDTAIEVSMKLRAQVELAHIYAELGRRLKLIGQQETHNNKTAEDYIHKAEEIFTRLDLSRDLEKLYSI